MNRVHLLLPLTRMLLCCAQVWLEGLKTNLNTFDVFRLPYANASRTFIGSEYPGRVRFFKGKSIETVPRYISEISAGTAHKCDLWFVDGDHQHGVPLKDLNNAIASAADGATIIADDCTHRFPEVKAAWRTLLKTGVIADAFNKTLNLPPPGGVKGWCVGRYAPKKGRDMQL